jgi:hypothetical protein
MSKCSIFVIDVKASFATTGKVYPFNRPKKRSGHMSIEKLRKTPLAEKTSRNPHSNTIVKLNYVS